MFLPRSYHVLCMASCAVLGLYCLPLKAETLKQTPKAKIDFSLPDEPKEKVEYDSEDMFGPTDGTDTNAQNERSVTFGLNVRSGKRGVDDNTGLPDKGQFRVYAPFAAVQYGLTDDLSVEATVFGDLRHVRNVPGLDDNSRASFDGFSTQFSYRLLERNRENRLGLGLSFEPRWARIADTEGVRQDSFSSEIKLLADYRLMDSRLWFATNLGYEPQIGRTKGSGAIDRQSTLTWSNALTARISDRVFFGAEAHYSRAYQGIAANQFLGHAIFAGPTLLIQFTKSASLKASFSSQIWGHSHNPTFAGYRLDLFNFEQNNATVKFNLNF